MQRRPFADYPAGNITGWNIYCDCGHSGSIAMRDHLHLETTGRIWSALRCSACGRGEPQVRVYVSAAAIAGGREPD